MGDTAVSKLENPINLFGEDYPLIQRMFPKAMPIDLVLLFKTSKSLGLSPILKEIYAMDTGNGTQIYVGKAGLSRKLNESGGFSIDYVRGFDDIAKDGLNQRNNHKLAARGFFVDAIIKTTDGRTLNARAYWDEYSPDLVRAKSSWDKYPISMLEKVAFCKAARHGLGISYSSIEELGLGEVEDDEERRDSNSGNSSKIAVQSSSVAAVQAQPPAEEPVVEGSFKEATQSEPEPGGDDDAHQKAATVVIWTGKEKFTDEKITAKTVGTAAFRKEFIEKFEAEPHFKNHVKKHFRKSAEDLTWEELNYMHEFLYKGERNNIYYKDVEAQAGKSVSGWDVFKKKKTEFEDRNLIEFYNEIGHHMDTVHGGIDPIKYNKALDTILTGVGMAFDDPPTVEQKKEIFVMLDKEFRK